MANSEQEAADAESRDKKAVRLSRVLSGGLDAAIGRMGCELLGMSIKTANGDCLITLRLSSRKGRMVSFVGGYDMAECFLKAFRMANHGTLTLKPDQYAKS